MKAIRLQDKLGKKNFHDDMKKVFEPATKSNKDISEEVTKTKTETSNIKKKQSTREIKQQTSRNHE